MFAQSAAPRENGVPAVPSDQNPATPAALLSASEISVKESGGIAGRVHSVRLIASSGQVEVEYRPREALPSAPPITGALPADRYLALWRELDSARIWELASPRPTSGADLIHTELGVRLRDSHHVVRWDEGHLLAPQVRRVSDIARRALAAGREATASR